MSTVVKVWRNPKLGDQAQTTLNTQNFTIDIQFIDNYLVQFSDNTAGPLDAMFASDGTTTIPATGDMYTAGGQTVYCTRVFPKRSTKYPTIFEVQVEWKNIPPVPDSSKWNVNIRVAETLFEQDAYADINQKPILNSAQQAFSPTLKRTFFDEELTVTFDTNDMQDVIAAIDQCKGHYNSDSITMSVNNVTRTFAAKTMLFASPTYSTIYTGQPPYTWKVGFIFRYRNNPSLDPADGGAELGWITQVPDSGYFKIVCGQKIFFKDKYGQLPSHPFLMNGAGDVLPPGGKPFYLQFDLHGPADFSDLLEGIS